MNSKIYSIKDIDNQIINYVNLEDLLNIGIINKYYNYLINNFILIKEIKLYKQKFIIGVPYKNLRNCCKAGLINLGNYLLNKYEIDIHMDGQWFFRLCCLYSHFDMAKWIWKIMKQKPYCIDWLFEWCCQLDKLEIVKWLSTSNCKYFFEEKDGKIINYKIKN